MKAPSPAFAFYPKDILTDEAVLQMTDEALGVYVRLLCHAWLEGSIPAEPSKLARMLRSNRRRFDTLWEAISPCWVPSTEQDSRLVNPRLEAERLKQVEFSTRQRERATQGYKPSVFNKPDEPRLSHGDAAAEPRHSRGPASPFRSQEQQRTNDRQMRIRRSSQRAPARGQSPGTATATHLPGRQAGDLEPDPERPDPDAPEVPDVFAPNSSPRDERPPVHEVPEGAPNPKPALRPTVSRGNGESVEATARPEPHRPDSAREGPSAVEGEASGASRAPDPAPVLRSAPVPDRRDAGEPRAASPGLPAAPVRGVPVPPLSPAGAPRADSARGVDSARDFLPRESADTAEKQRADRAAVASELAALLRGGEVAVSRETSVTEGSGTRQDLERELMRNVRAQAELEGRDWYEAYAEATGFEGQKRRGPMDPRRLTDERLLNSVLDSRVNLESARKAKRGAR